MVDEPVRRKPGRPKGSKNKKTVGKEEQQSRNEKNILDENPENQEKREKNFLEQYLEQQKLRKTMEQTHTRQTYLIENELIRRLRRVSSGRKGFKTQFVNYAIRKVLDEIDGVNKQKETLKITTTTIAEESNNEVKDSAKLPKKDKREDEDNEDQEILFDMSKYEK